MPKYTEFIPHVPTPKQEAFLWLNCLDAFFGGAAGGGKSDALLMAALQYVDIPKYNAILIRDTFKNLSMVGSLMDRANEWLRPTKAHWDGDNKRWRFPSGATLSFGYLDGPNDHFNYQSAEFQFVGIDEAVNIRENQALYMFSRLRRLKGSSVPIRFRCASNPPTREQIAKGQWVKDRYVNKFSREKDVVFIPSFLRDNPFLDKDEYVKSLMNLDPITRAQLLEGDWEINAKGELFDRAWFEIVDVAPAEMERVRYWDLAATDYDPAKRKQKENKGQEPAFTSGCKMGKTPSGVYYIENVLRFQKTPRYVEALVRQTADTDGRSVDVWMEQEPGSGGKNTIDHYRRNILPEYHFRGNCPQGSKIERAMPLSSQAEAGNIKLVRGHWNKDFLDEIELFPNGKFKDQIDSASGAFDMLACHGIQVRMRMV